ncbi:MAG: hypothetical protein HYX25_04185 [Candidatus Solibacter usitatus]|nr:hypothetical protein [Candidatus Solibacter usitatus]
MKASFVPALFLLSVILFPGSSSSNAQPVTHTCTNASISGNYGFSVSGLVVSSGFLPFVAAGTLTSDGNGNLTGKDAATEGQSVSRTLTGTYIVNADCSGSVTLHDNLGNNSQFNVRIAGDAIQFMQTDGGTIIAGEAKRRRSVCVVQDISGTYSFALSGWYYSGGVPQAFTDAGKLTGDGGGNFSLVDAVSQAGTITNRTISGTYVVNADCTGLATFTDPTLGALHANFTVLNAGREIQFIQTDPNTVISGSATRQFSPAGVLSHIASGGFWKTTITLVSLKPSPNEVRVSFRAENGAPLTLPLSVTLQGASTPVTASSVDRTIPPGGTLVIETEAPLSPLAVGWAQVFSSGPVEGSAIFRARGATDSEGTAPLDSNNATNVILPYDETPGFTTGAAFVNLLNTGAASITAIVRDDSGTQLGTASTLSIPANGHTSFAVSTQFPATVGKRGTIELLDNSGGSIAGLGLRFNAFGSFTSVPLTVKQ